MDPITIGLLAGAGMGLIKGGYLDKKAEAKDRQEQAAIARYSPWTGMKPTPVKRADPLGSTMQGAMGGAMLGGQFPAGGGGGAAAASTETGIAGADVGAGGTPLAPDSQFYQPNVQPPMTQGQYGQYANKNYFQPWNYTR